MLEETPGDCNPTWIVPPTKLARPGPDRDKNLVSTSEQVGKHTQVGQGTNGIGPGIAFVVPIEALPAFALAEEFGLATKRVIANKATTNAQNLITCALLNFIWCLPR